MGINSTQRPGIGNLRPAKKGEVRNPGGSNGVTKRRAEDAALAKEILARTDDKGITKREAMILAQIERAIKGDTAAFIAVMDIARGGKLPLAITGADGVPLLPPGGGGALLLPIGVPIE